MDDAGGTGAEEHGLDDTDWFGATDVVELIGDDTDCSGVTDSEGDGGVGTLEDKEELSKVSLWGFGDD